MDEGGVQKEFFQLVVREMFDPKYGKCIPYIFIRLVEVNYLTPFFANGISKILKACL